VSEQEPEQDLFEALKEQHTETKQRKTFKMTSSELSRCSSVTFKLLRHYKRDKGFMSKLSSSHPYDFQMKIKTDPLGWEVDRSLRQFQGLR